MTAVAAIADGLGNIYMGGDSAGVGGLRLTVRADSKVFINGNMILGFTSSYRMGNLLRYSFTPPEHPESMSVDVYMNTLFIDEVRKCFKDGGYIEIDKNTESGGTFMVGYKGELFIIHGDFQVGIPATQYHAVGCGMDLCLGVLHYTDDYDISPWDRITAALKAAESFSAGVRGPYTILSLEK